MITIPVFTLLMSLLFVFVLLAAFDVAILCWMLRGFTFEFAVACSVLALTLWGVYAMVGQELIAALQAPSVRFEWN
jgi:hypothetical protein